MIEKQMDLWDAHTNGEWIVITTNGTVKNNGEAVMGRGCAREAKLLYPQLPKELGTAISLHGNLGFVYLQYRIITFPVKHNWWEKANIDLIERSAARLLMLLKFSPTNHVYMPRPGCGNGRLKWADVKPVLEKYLDDRFIVVTK